MAACKGEVPPLQAQVWVGSRWPDPAVLREVLELPQDATRSTRPIDAKLWEKTYLWIMFNVRVLLVVWSGLGSTDIRISRLNTIKYNKVDTTNRCEALKKVMSELFWVSITLNVTEIIELPKISVNWNFWIFWNLCERILIFQYLY